MSMAWWAHRELERTERHGNTYNVQELILPQPRYELGDEHRQQDQECDVHLLLSLPCPILSWVSLPKKYKI